jgi:hypothetical protein
MLTASYEDRSGETFETTETIQFEDREYPALGQWERQSMDLRVSPDYAERFERFAAYFESEIEAMREDLAVVRTLVDVGNGGTVESAGDERRDVDERSGSGVGQRDGGGPGEHDAGVVDARPPAPGGVGPRERPQADPHNRQRNHRTPVLFCSAATV